MVANKHSSKIILALMAVAVVLCFLAVAFSGQLTGLLGGTSVRMEYESALFDTDEIISVDIQMDEDEWNRMLSNAMSEEYYVCNVVINGKRINSVAIRPKGNTSLSAIAMDPDNNRYSLKLEFDHFVDGQTCFGLDKLILNNNYADATNMKEALIYDMYQYLGAEASLYNYAKVSVNGEYWGVYLALEAVEESFQLRNFGTQDGELYKPDSMDMGGAGSDSSSKTSMPDMGNMDFSQFAGKTPPSNAGGARPSRSGGSSDTESADAPTDGGASFGGFSFDPDNMPDMGDFDLSNLPDMGDFDPNSIPDMGAFDSGSIPDLGGGNADSEPAAESDESGDAKSGSSRGGFSKRGGGANLNYTDDELDSYSTIWDGAITGTSKADHRRVVTALKNISEGTDLEQYLDVDNVLKYMAVHTFSVNMDSLSGSMAHNYYLYEYEGKLNLFPWDYNLSFGGMSMGSGGDGTSVVNDAIDTPFSGTHFFDSLLENEDYLARYHGYLQQLVDAYVNGGRLDETYQRIRSQIDALVETDPNAMYSYEQYQNAAEILYEVVKLRAQSIDGQLNGTIPSTDAGQREDDSALIDASHIDVEAMGKFNMGGFSAGSPNRRSGRSNSQTTTETAETTEVTEPSTAPSTEATTAVTVEPTAEATTETAEATEPAHPAAPGNLPDGFDPNNLPDGFDPGNLPDSFDPNDLPDGFDADSLPDRESFRPGSKPDMGGMTPPSGTAPNASASDDAQQAAPAQDAGDFQAADDASAPQTSDGAQDGNTDERSSQRPASFSGVPDRGSDQTTKKNLRLYGLCLIILLAALAAAMIFKRKR